MTDTISVLLIGDSDVDHELIKRCLGKCRARFDLHWSDRLNKGVERLDAGHYAIVLLDLSLPDSHGLETVRAVRDEYRDLPIVVLTTLDDCDTALESLSAGAQDYLIKGEITPNSLERAIQHAIQRQESVEQVHRLLAEVEEGRRLLAEQQELLKAKNRRLRRLYKTAQRFVDNVSHEFRTPLTVIKDYVSLVREGLAGPVSDEQGRMLDIANVRTNDLNNMVDDMLDASKLESGLLGVWRRPCSFAGIIDSVYPPLAKKAEVKGISFETAVDQRLPLVYCDGEQVGRVVINLVTNAMKFCGDPGVVRLWAEENPEWHEIVVGVSDNGPGISEQGLTEIFRGFKQIRTGIRGSCKGVGLGLNIAKELVQLNLGEIRVESTPRKGSTFSFTVPLAEPIEIMRRYLAQIHQVGDVATIALVRASLAESESSESADDMDAFFNFLLRENDLLFRCGSHQWLYALPVPRTEVDQFLRRARGELAKTNRNRRLGPLPEFDLEPRGMWNAFTEGDLLLNHVQEVFEAETLSA